MNNYQRTKTACYLGFITQAIAANFAPLLFLKYHTDYNIPLGKVALISTCFFLTQLAVDLFCDLYHDQVTVKDRLTTTQDYAIVSVKNNPGVARVGGERGI